MRLLNIYSIVFLFIAACATNDTTPSDSTVDFEQALKAQGLSQYNKFDLTFTFRNREYQAIREGGNFDYFRYANDSSQRQTIDHLSNKGFTRTLAQDTLILTPEKAHAYGESVNSVIYFALLPYFLTDAAVVSKTLGEVKIHGQSYHKVRVTFGEKGGGADHDDIFVYWFHTQTHELEYLAYSYNRDGGGVRFRKAVNSRKVEGVRFADYINYKHPNPKFNVEETDQAFEEGKLEKLSEIVLEDIRLTLEN